MPKMGPRIQRGPLCNSSVRWSPFYGSKLAVAQAQNYGLVGTGAVTLLSVSWTCFPCWRVHFYRTSPQDFKCKEASRLQIRPTMSALTKLTLIKFFQPAVMARLSCGTWCLPLMLDLSSPPKATRARSSTLSGTISTRMGSCQPLLTERSNSGTLPNCKRAPNNPSNMNLRSTKPSGTLLMRAFSVPARVTRLRRSGTSGADNLSKVSMLTRMKSYQLTLISTKTSSPRHRLIT